MRISTGTWPGCFGGCVGCGACQGVFATGLFVSWESCVACNRAWLHEFAGIWDDAQCDSPICYFSSAFFLASIASSLSLNVPSKIDLLSMPILENHIPL